MPTGRPKCPICQGKGTLIENTREYEFITRDPITSKCMICNGEGWLNPSTRLPNGKRVFEVFRKENGTQMTGSTGSAGSGKRLNVSKKAVVNPGVDTGVGYGAGPKLEDAFNTEKNRGKRRKAEGLGLDSRLRGNDKGGEPYNTPMFIEMATNPRLNKVLASGKNFLIITETEPYYLEVYRMIRKQEKKQDTWTKQDEERYVEALEEGYDSLMLDSGLRRNDNVGWNDKTSIRDKKEAFNG